MLSVSPPKSQPQESACAASPSSESASRSSASTTAPARSSSPRPPREAIADAEIDAGARSSRSTTATSPAARPSASSTRARSPRPLLGLPTIPTTRFENACATSHAAFRHAVMEIGSGVSDVVLVGGAERILHVPDRRRHRVLRVLLRRVVRAAAGLTFPGVFALIARAHMDKYGTTEEQMAHVAVKNHRHGDPQSQGPVPKRDLARHGAQEPVRRRPAEALRLLPVHRRGRGRRPRLRGRRARATAGPCGCSAREAASDTMFIHEKRDLARVTATERAAAARLPAGGQDAGRRRRGRAARLLHHRRDRRHRGPRASSSLAPAASPPKRAGRASAARSRSIPPAGSSPRAIPSARPAPRRSREIVTQLRGEAGRAPGRRRPRRASSTPSAATPPPCS